MTFKELLAEEGKAFIRSILMSAEASKIIDARPIRYRRKSS